MKKSLYKLTGICCGALVCTALWGCGAGTLWDEIPKDFGLQQETEEEAAVDNAVRVVSLEDMLAGRMQEENGTERANQADPADLAERESFLGEEVFPYAYESLSAEEKRWYEDIEGLLGSFGEKTELDGSVLDCFDASGVDDTVDKIFRCVLQDRPEIYYVDGYSCTKYMRGEKIVSVEFFGSYTMDKETARKYKTEIEEGARAVLAGIGEGASDYEKVKYVYETIIRSTDYDLDAPDNQNIYSVFVNHRSVCQGYAKAAQYLLNRLGVESTLVLGTVDTGEGHAWNLVRVDGEYYYLDATWGDVSYQVDEKPEGDAAEDGGTGEGSVSMPEINYDYLNITTQELLRTHSVGGIVEMPVCSATAANYYWVEGAYFATYDREQMAALFDRAQQQDKGEVHVKCADEVCYQEIYDALVERQEIFTYFGNEEGGIAYARNEKQLSMTFWVTNE